jgi:hypothetical protein
MRFVSPARTSEPHFGWRLTWNCAQSGLSLRHRWLPAREQTAYWSEAITALAGPAAEQRYGGYPQGAAARLRCSAWKTDYRNAYDWLRQMDSTVTLKECEAMARHLTDEH